MLPLRVPPRRLPHPDCRRSTGRPGRPSRPGLRDDAFERPSSFAPPPSGTPRRAGWFSRPPSCPTMPSAHELLDAGDDRRLERFGDLLVERPAPDTPWPVRDPSAWPGAALRFDRGRGWTAARGPLPESWLVDDDDLRFELRPTASGQVGLFPEQAATRAWVR